MDLMIKGSRTLAARAREELLQQSSEGEQKDGSNPVAGSMAPEAAAKLLEGIEVADQPIDDDIDGLERSIQVRFVRERFGVVISPNLTPNAPCSNIPAPCGHAERCGGICARGECWKDKG